MAYQHKVSTRSHVIIALNLSFLASVFLFLDPASFIVVMTAAPLLTLSCAVGLRTSSDLLAKITADIWSHEKLALLSFYLGRVALPYINWAAFIASVENIVLIALLLQVAGLSFILLLEDSLRPHAAYLMRKKESADNEPANLDILKTPNYNEDNAESAYTNTTKPMGEVKTESSR